MNPIEVPFEQIGVNLGYYSFSFVSSEPFNGLIVNIFNKTEDTIFADVYTQRVSSTDNEFYIFDGESIVRKNGASMEEIIRFVDDVLRQIWSVIGYDTFNIYANTGVPSTVDYIVRTES